MPAQQTNLLPDQSKGADLANQASSENLPRVSAALLRTQIQQEQDPVKRLDLSRRLVTLLVSTGRYEEALAVVSTMDVSKDPALTYWKGLALLGAGDEASLRSAAEILSSLWQAPVPGISSVSYTHLTLPTKRIV